MLAACVGLLLPAGPVQAQAPSGIATHTIPAAQVDSVRTDSIRHPVPSRASFPGFPGGVRRPPPGTRAPWACGPKRRYAHTGTLVGAGVGALYALSEGEHPVPGAFFFGLFGYMVGMMFD